MSTIRQHQQSEKIQQSVTDGIVEHMLDGTGTDDESTPGAKRSLHGKPHGKAGAKHAGHAAGLGAKDGVDKNAAKDVSKADATGSTQSLASDQPADAATSSHLSAVADFTDAHATGRATAGGTSTTTAADDSAVSAAHQQLEQDLGAAQPDSQAIKTDTSKYMDALRASGASASTINDKINQLAQAPGTSDAAAQALVEAAKDGLNTDDSNQDKAAQAMAQKGVDQKRDLAKKQADQQAAQQSDSSGGSGGGGSADASGDSGDAADASSASSTDATNGQVNDASGNGQYGDVNVPANSKDYKGMSIDQLLASKGPVGDAMRKRPDLVEDIKKASAATGVPAGLLAGLTYLESSFGSDASTTTDHDGDATGGVTQVQQSIVSKLVPGGNMSNAADNIMACAKGLKNFYDASQSWGAALRGWNTFDPTDSENVRQVGSLKRLDDASDGGTSHYVSDILNSITAKGTDP